MPKLTPQQALDILARYATGPFVEINTALVKLQQTVDLVTNKKPVVEEDVKPSETYGD